MKTPMARPLVKALLCSAFLSAAAQASTSETLTVYPEEPATQGCPTKTQINLDYQNQTASLSDFTYGNGSCPQVVSQNTRIYSIAKADELSDGTIMILGEYNAGQNLLILTDSRTTDKQVHIEEINDLENSRQVTKN